MSDFGDVAVWQAAKAVWEAAENGDEAYLRRLIERGGSVYWNNPWEHGDTALMRASDNGHEGCVRLLIASGAIVNARNVSLERPLPSTRHGSASMQ